MDLIVNIFTLIHFTRTKSLGGLSFYETEFQINQGIYSIYFFFLLFWVALSLD